MKLKLISAMCLSAFLMQTMPAHAQADAIQRMTTQGDTLVFRPEAYRLEETALLEQLLTHLPGVTLRDGELTWNGKPMAMMVNGQEMYASNRALLSQLSLADMDALLVYDRATEAEHRNSRKDGNRNYVLDIRLKRASMNQIHGEVDATGGAGPRYNLRGMVNRQGDKNSFGIFGNWNNMSNDDEEGMRWSADRQSMSGYGKKQYLHGAYQHNWDTDVEAYDRNHIMVDANFNHTDGWANNDMYQERFDIPGRTITDRFGDTKQRNDQHLISPSINVSYFQNINENNTVEAKGHLDYARQDNHTFFTSEGWTDAGFVITEQREENNQYVDRSLANADLGWTHFLNDHTHFTTSAMVDYSHRSTRKYDQYYHRYSSDGWALDTENRSYINTNTLGYQMTVGAKEDFTTWLTDYLRFNAAYTFKSVNEDVSNRTNHMISLNAMLHLGDWNITPGMDLEFDHHYIKDSYHSNAVEFNRKDNLFNPYVTLLWQKDATQAFEAELRSRQVAPVLYSAIVDDSSPLLVTRYSKNYDKLQQYEAAARYHKTFIPLQLNIMLGASYRHLLNPIGVSVEYDAALGNIRQNVVRNVDGNHETALQFNFYKGLGKWFYLKNDMDLSFYKVSGSEIALSSSYNTLTATALGTKSTVFTIRPEFGFSNSWLTANIHAGITTNHTSYIDYDGKDLDTKDLSYGLYAKVHYGPFELATDITNVKLVGYSASGKHQTLWSGEARYHFLKNKAAAVLVRYTDILESVKTRTESINEYQKVVRRTTRLHNYAEIGLSYCF